MKNKILTVFLLAALTSFGDMLYYLSTQTEAYDGDEAADASSVASYTGYYCTYEQAQKLFGGTSCGTIESYVSKNFETAKSASDVIAFDSTSYGDDQYALLKYSNQAFTSSDYISIAFYGDEAFRVFGAGSAALTGGRVVFDDQASSAGTFGEWTTVVPEPTSGLLLLIGLAGIALKRKRTRKPMNI